MDDATKRGSNKEVPAPEVLSAEIQRLARKGEFRRAEKMREQLQKNFPMALSDIISSAEMIEDAKQARIDPEHLAIWDRLYSGLGKEETNAVYYGMRAVKVPAGKLIVSQGKPNPRLFFLERGRVTLFHTRVRERLLIGQLGRGDLAGEDSFFDISNSTVSIGSQTETQLRYLDKATMDGWSEDFPGLAQKIEEYCRKNGRSSEILRSRKLEKRRYRRYPLQGRVTAHILDGEGQRTDRFFRGTLQDVSRNGLSFDIHCARTRTAQALLGRSLEIELEAVTGGQPAGRFLKGKIVRVGFHLYNDYCVHVWLNQVMTSAEIDTILGRDAWRG